MVRSVSLDVEAAIDNKSTPACDSFITLPTVTNYFAGDNRMGSSSLTACGASCPLSTLNTIVQGACNPSADTIYVYAKWWNSSSGWYTAGQYSLSPATLVKWKFPPWLGSPYTSARVTGFARTNHGPYHLRIVFGHD